ncbi:hypothetical protein [Nonomuraea wenchangensis]|uniref:hypothetical protein n=1 Tax=Nonomuraea wenchangensis TaxID=568860 RepID=UPI0033F2E75A
MDIQISIAGTIAYEPRFFPASHNAPAGTGAVQHAVDRPAMVISPAARLSARGQQRLKPFPLSVQVTSTHAPIVTCSPRSVSS